MNFHIICERDVGLFSLIQQVIANIPWAFKEQRIPIIYYHNNTCYWTPNGYQGKDTVWEYYFEPVIPEYPASVIPMHILHSISAYKPSAFDVGYFIDDHYFISAHFGDHSDIKGKALSIPYLLDDPDDALRLETSIIIEQYIRPRNYIMQKVEAFFQANMSDSYLIGVHIRGTDAISPQEVRTHRKGSLTLDKYVHEIQRILIVQPNAKLFVATDAQSSLTHMLERFGDRVIAYDSIRHEQGEAVGKGPTGWIMPAYVAEDRDRAAQNGEEAVIEYLLLSRCNCLLHNASSLARTVLLKIPEIPHINTHCKSIYGGENNQTITH